MQPLFAVLWICHVVSAQSAQSIITLWQFEKGNLLSAQVTLPLTPLGTAADGLSTTYLYQALNNVVRTDQTSDGVTQVVTFGSATPRTIVASASGWVENLASPSRMIACSLINSAEGNCIYASFFASSTTTLTGPTVAPFPETLTVATSTPLTTTPLPPSHRTIALPSTTQVSPPPNTAQPENSSKKSTSVGSIVGGVIGGLAGLSTLLVLFLLWRRRRLQELKAAGTISAFDAEFAQPNEVLRHPVSRDISAARYEFEGEGIYTAPNSNSNRFAVGGTVSKAARVARAQIPTSSFVNINTSSQGASSSELEIAPQSLHITMAEIATRLRRLEMNNNHIMMEPPPRYAENV